MLTNIPRAQTAKDVNTAEDQKEEESDAFHKDILDNPYDAAAANIVNEEQELKTENTTGPIL